ncbi:MAG: SPOR domain-containing protein [Deltaproteobacteria bacterium]|nr:SPOR domain-containing protein [Deltaproteobacteria bacterium]
MSRLKGQREIWITRGHLWALGATTVFIGILAFFVGLLLGRGDSAPEPEVQTASLLPPDVENDTLDELLARVEEASRERGRGEPLTFQGTLPAGTTAPLPEPGAEPGPEGVVVPPARQSPEPPDAEPEAGEVPQDGWAVQVGSYSSASEADQRIADLSDRGVAAYRVSALVGGSTWHRVRVGGFDSREAADAARARVAVESGSDEAIVVKAP